MTSAEFELTAKACIIANFCNVSSPDEMHTVWYARILGSMKGIFIDTRKDNQDIYEVTYNASTDEMYIDRYSKVRNLCVAHPNVATLSYIQPNQERPAVSAKQA